MTKCGGERSEPWTRVAFGEGEDDDGVSDDGDDGDDQEDDYSIDWPSFQSSRGGTHHTSPLS